MIKFISGKTEKEASLSAALVMADIVKNNPSGVIGLATGSSPINMYKELIAMYDRGEISFKDIKSVNLDEYVTLGEGDEQSYVTFMRENFFNHVDIDLKNTYLPNGKASDLQAECDRYNELLAKMPQDLQLLGIGSNGHIGFNEPGTAEDSVTHIVELTESTIKDNSRLFNSIEEVPTKALSMPAVRPWA